MRTDVAAPLQEIAAGVRAERQRAGVSLSELARRAGISKLTLSQVEAGTGNPSVETLWAIATALGIPFSRLVAIDEHAPPRLVRAAERAPIGATDSEFAAALLAAGRRDERRDLYVVVLDDARPRDAEPHPRGSVEHVVVGAGRVRVGPADRLTDLEVGDYLSFPGDVPHRYEALEAGSWFVLVMQHPAP